MADEFLGIHIAATGPSSTDELTVAELAVLLTAVNRSINKIAASGAVFSGADYSPLSQEPMLVQLRVARVRQGSVVIQAAIDAFNAIGLDPDTAKQLLLGILANALFDPGRTQTLIYDFTRALQRIAYGAVGKTFTVTLSFKRRVTRLYGNVIEGEGLKVSVEHDIPDDIQ